MVSDVESDGAVEAQRTGPPTVSTVLVVLATVLAVVATVTTWARTQLLDTNEWVRASDALLADPDVQDALGDYVATQLFESVDLQSELEELLPEELSTLAGPLAGSLRSPVENGIDRIIASDQLAALWSASNRTAHSTLVAILRDDTADNVSTADGVVSIDLRPLVIELGTEVGFPEQALEQIPEDVGTIVVFESDELDAAQRAVAVFDFLSWFLFLVVVALYALAIALARGHRLAVVRRVGISTVIGSVVVLLLRALGLRAVVGATVENVANEPAARAIGDVATSLMSEIAWTGVVYGLGIIFVAWLLGTGSWARRTREAARPVLESPVALAVAGLVLVLVLVWWSPGRAFQSWWRVLTLAVVVIATLVAMQRMVATEDDSPRDADEPPNDADEPPSVADEPPSVAESTAESV